MKSLIASLRVALASMVACVIGYTGLILAVAQLTTPDTANGQLITGSDGIVIGSRLIAQKFERPEYFWPRPSAVDYNGAGAGGSNKSPTNPALTERALGLIEQYGATPERPLPPELVAASGAGLDPHISVDAALYQVERVSLARGVAAVEIEGLVREHAFAPGGFLTPDRLINVLELNLALDALASPPR